MAKRPPCGGCPPCCSSCVFSAQAETPPTETTVVVPEKTYGCVHGGDVVRGGNGQLGLLRHDGFRPVTPAGAAFLRTTGNPLGFDL